MPNNGGKIAMVVDTNPDIQLSLMAVKACFPAS